MFSGRALLCALIAALAVNAVLYRPAVSADYVRMEARKLSARDDGGIPSNPLPPPRTATMDSGGSPAPPGSCAP